MHPKPARRSKQRRNREIDVEYIRWVKGWSCCLCGAYPVDAHHVVSKGAMGSDRTCIPVCHYHHIGWIHTKGAQTTATHFKVNFESIVEEFNRKYESKEKGPFDHLTSNLGPSRLTVS